MSFGLSAPTTAGTIDITTIRALRLTFSRTCSTANGSFASTTQQLQNAIFQVEVLDGKAAPSVIVTGTTVNWTENELAVNPSTSFKIHFLKMV